MKPTINPALQPDALYAKSQVYIHRALRAQSNNEADEYQLWASLSLELLGKAALARVHPALIADPQHFHSLFAACGRQISADLRTITASTLFLRLSHIEKEFDTRHQKFCEQMALRRNAELHSGESPFLGMLPETWEREFWGAIEMLLKIQNESLDSWLGAEDAKTPTKIIEQAEQALQWAVDNRVKRCSEDFEKSNPDPKRRQDLIEQFKKTHWSALVPKWLADADGHDRSECPACRSSGILAGSLWSEEVTEVESSYPEIGEDGYQIGEIPTEEVEKTFGVDDFYCPVCKLRLTGRKEIAAAEVPTEFTETEQREREFEPDYGND